tara:strand:- start:547 stop:699 length:153 start_codon:yes stop_codon:yes gene_type:complete
MSEAAINGVIGELRQHIQTLSDRAASLAGELATAHARIAALENPDPPPDE